MILGLKTSDPTTHMWLFSPKLALTSEHPVAHTTWESGRDLSDQLLGRLITFLKDNSCPLDHLKGIIIFSGPGSFTSLRIGHTTANALASSLNIPIVGAVGESWIKSAIAALETTPSGQFALPHYGSEAHVTRPKT